MGGWVGGWASRWVGGCAGSGLEQCVCHPAMCRLPGLQLRLQRLVSACHPALPPRCRRRPPSACPAMAARQPRRLRSVSASPAGFRWAYRRCTPALPARRSCPHFCGRPPPNAPAVCPLCRWRGGRHRPAAIQPAPDGAAVRPEARGGGAAGAVEPGARPHACAGVRCAAGAPRGRSGVAAHPAAIDPARLHRSCCDTLRALSPPQDRGPPKSLSVQMTCAGCRLRPGLWDGWVAAACLLPAPSTRGAGHSAELSTNSPLAACTWPAAHDCAVPRLPLASAA